MRITNEMFQASKQPPQTGRWILDGLIPKLIETDPDPQMALEDLQNQLLYRPEYFPEDRIEEVMETKDPEKVAFLLIQDNDPEKLDHLADQFQDLSEMDSVAEMMKVIPTMDSFLQRLQ